ncbi:MAG: cell division ATP-binding protein FtsE [Culicoidibacterales bacterium]
MRLIKVSNVSKIYKNHMKALNDISVAIEDGEFVYVVGHSGAGKSTFIKLLYREERATSGSVIVNDLDLTKIANHRVHKYRRMIGVVFQDFKLLPNLTAYENVAYALEVHGEDKETIREKVKDSLELVGLIDKMKQFPNQLSGGEQQRVAIARAIVNKPTLLIADEPTGNLDPVTSQTIMDVLEEVNRRGTTVVMATHDIHLVNESRKRTLTFENGVVISDAKEGGYFYDDEVL